MKKLIAGLAFVLLAACGLALAQTSYLPIPSGVCATAGQPLVAVDANNVACTGAATIGSSGTPITQIRVYSQTFTPASVATITCATQTFTVTGLTTADKVLFNPIQSSTAVAATQYHVSAADTLSVKYCNPTAGAVTPTAGTGTVIAFRS